MVKLGIIGLGSILWGDDGIGPAVINKLEKSPLLHQEVKIIPEGASLLNHYPDFLSWKHILIIDCVQGGGQPGTVYELPWSQYGPMLTTPNFLGHEDEIFFGVPPITVIGIEPENLDWGHGLSKIILDKLPKLVEHIEKNWINIAYARE